MNSQTHKLPDAALQAKMETRGESHVKVVLAMRHRQPAIAAGLQPYTDHTLEALAKEGVRNVHVICPGFSVDCLETVEEVAMENRDIFIEAGGEQYGYIECLNDHASHIQLFSELIAQHTRGWAEY